VLLSVFKNISVIKIDKFRKKYPENIAIYLANFAELNK